jgi:uncharacterized membrane protein YgdD (TMEM256/DUF423 family)
LGAFGAHGLKSALEERQKSDSSLTAEEAARLLDVWDTGAHYQMYHALGMLAVGFVAARRCGLTIHLAGTAMTLGTLIFSGCLYALVLTGQRWLGAVVPVGGLLMIIGWALLAVAITGLERGAACRVAPGARP